MKETSCKICRESIVLCANSSNYSRHSAGKYEDFKSKLSHILSHYELNTRLGGSRCEDCQLILARDQLKGHARRDLGLKCSVTCEQDLRRIVEEIRNILRKALARTPSRLKMYELQPVPASLACTRIQQTSCDVCGHMTLSGSAAKHRIAHKAISARFMYRCVSCGLYLRSAPKRSSTHILQEQYR
jgi:Zn ribbon nucleic-acid-binding protein